MRQVLHNTDKDILLNVPLNNEQEVRRQWGTPSGTVVFKYGYVSFTTDGKIELSQPIYGIKSIRLIVDIDTTTEDVIKLSSTHSVSIAAGTITATGFSSPTIYVDGVATSTVTAGKAEITITTATSFKADNIVLGYISSYFEGKIYEVQLYNIVLDSSSVINLFNSARYVMPSLEHGEQLGEEMVDQDAWYTAVYWNTFAANWLQLGSTLVSDGSGNLIKTGFWEVGKRYKITRTQTRTAGTITGPYDFIIIAGQSSVSDTKTYYVTAGQTTMGINANIYEGVITALSIKEVMVEPTSKILHVNANQGVVRNQLSGDLLETLNVSTCVNGDYDSFLNATSTGFDVIHNTSGTQFGGTADEINIVSGKQYSVTFGLVLNSGALPGIRLYTILPPGTVRSDTFISIEGMNTIVLTANATDTVQLGFYSTVNANYEITNLQVQEIIPEVINTDIEVVRDSPGLVPRFNGSSSKIDCGDYSDLDSDLTILAWIRINDIATGTYKRILNNGQLTYFYNASLKYVGIISASGGTNIYSSTYSAKEQEYQLLAVTRKADGTAQHYIDGAVNGSSGDSGTPVAGTSNIAIGSNSAAATEVLNGQIPEVIVIDGLLTPSEISAYYTSTKHLYF